MSQVVLTPKASTVMKGMASGLRETITERYVTFMCSMSGHYTLCCLGFNLPETKIKQTPQAMDATK